MDGRVIESKWEQFYWDINHQSRKKRAEKYFQFYWNCERMEVEARNSVSLCQIYFPIVIGTTHISFKMFSQWIDCSVARDYHENNKVKDFLAQTFRLSCLSDFKKLPYHEFEWCPRKHLWRNSFFKKVAGLNPATLLRIEFFCVRFSGVFLRIIGRLNSSRLDDLIALTRIMDGFVICWDHGCYSNVGYIQNAFFIRKIFKRKWTSKTQKS